MRLLNNYYDTRDLFESYGSEYTGIYLALFFTLAVFVIYERKNRAFKSYVSYMAGICLFLFIPGLLKLISNWIWKKDLGHDYFMVFPVIIASIFGFALIGKYMTRDESNDKAARSYKGFIIAFAIFLLAEASVPIQINFLSLELPASQGKYSREAKAISEIVKADSVYLPSDLRNQIKKYNWDTYTPTDQSTDDINEYELFNQASEQNLSYVVVKIKNNLGDTNEETINQAAGAYGYSVVDKIGKYLVYKAPTE